MKKIVLTKRAVDLLETFFQYLESEWSVKTRDEFIEKFENAVFQIQKFPEIAPKSKEIPNLHKYILTKQTSLFYRVDKTSITIITVFDNRMNPKVLNYLTTKKL
ncbi:MAG: type II toxin-antitoxin system RelE/ParE family toxin [Draconibacterium sp.]